MCSCTASRTSFRSFLRALRLFLCMVVHTHICAIKPPSSAFSFNLLSGQQKNRTVMTTTIRRALRGHKGSAGCFSGAREGALLCNWLVGSWPYDCLMTCPTAFPSCWNTVLFHHCSPFLHSPDVLCCSLILVCSCQRACVSADIANILGTSDTISAFCTPCGQHARM